MNKKIADLLNDQVNMEFYSAYLYLEMTNYFNGRGLEGFAHWYRVQAHEECEHALKIVDYLHEEDVAVHLAPIAKPEARFSCDMDVANDALKHEMAVTRSIHNIYELATDQHDYRTLRFLDWFVTEQAEEEKNARDMVCNIRLFGNNGEALYLLNRDLGKREE